MSYRPVNLDRFDVDPTDDRIVYAAGGELARELIPNGLAWRTPSKIPLPCYLCAHPIPESGAAKCRLCRCRDHVAINTGDNAHEFAREQYREMRKRDARESAAARRRSLGKKKRT